MGGCGPGVCECCVRRGHQARVPAGRSLVRDSLWTHKGILGHIIPALITEPVY